MIKAILRIEDIDHSPFDRLDHDYSGIEVCLLIGIPYDPVDKCPQEVAFSELNYLFGITDGACRISIQCFHIDF
jgi:hypothetical protein